jgi:hypothetical protein
MDLLRRTWPTNLCFFSFVKEITMAEFLGEFEQLVLLALVRLGPDAYGVTICDDIAERSGRAVSLGACANARSPRDQRVRRHVAR